MSLRRVGTGRGGMQSVVFTRWSDWQAKRDSEEPLSGSLHRLEAMSPVRAASPIPDTFPSGKGAGRDGLRENDIDEIQSAIRSSYADWHTGFGSNCTNNRYEARSNRS